MKKKKKLLISEIARQVFLRKKVTPFKRWMEKSRFTSYLISDKTGLSASGVRKMCRWKDLAKHSCMLVSKAYSIPPEIMMFPERYENAVMAEESFKFIRKFLKNLDKKNTR